MVCNQSGRFIGGASDLVTITCLGHRLLLLPLSTSTTLECVGNWNPRTGTLIEVSLRQREFRSNLLVEI